MFDDDWESSVFIYPRESESGAAKTGGARPPITLLVVTVGDNVIFDPSKEELAVAEAALAVSVAEVRKAGGGGGDMDVDSKAARELKLLSIRMIDPPSRLTPPGVPNGTTAGTGGGEAAPTAPAATNQDPVEGVWKAPLGGTKFGVLDGIIQAVLEKGGVADEVLDGLDGVDLA